MKKIFTVSLVAVMAATAANADIASTKYVTDRTGNTTFTGSVAGSADLTVAVNTLAGKVDTVAGEGEGSVAEQISSALEDYTNTTNMNSAINSAKTELQGNIDAVDGKADANAGEISTLKTTSATKTELSEGLALKEDKSNKSTGVTPESTDAQYPSAKAVYNYVQAVRTELNEGVSGEIGDLEAAVSANKTAAETGIAEAKTAAANALADAKTYADEKDTAQTTAITNAYKAADTALETSLKSYADTAEADAISSAKTYTDGEIDKVEAAYVAADKKISDSIGTVAEGKTVVGLIEEAKTAASTGASTALNDYKTTNDAAVQAAQAAANKAQGDIDAYKTSNDAAVAKAQTDAVASAKTYTDGEIDKVEAAYAAADTALETSLKSYADTAEADAIAAAKTAGDAAYAAKSYETIVDADKAFRESITKGTTGSDGQYALTATVSNGTVSGYKWEQIGR